jgi:Contact-dependent growth inhibition CdiA C-terminal domain
LPSTVAEQTPDGGSTSKSSAVTPSQAPDSNRKPEGTPTEVKSDPKDYGEEETARGHTRENESAVTMAQSGYQTVQNPPTAPNGKNPDYTIEGEYADGTAPKTTAASAYRGIETKVEEGQAAIIVVNLDDGPDIDATDLENNWLRQYPIPGLKQVFILRGGQIVKNVTF